MLRKPSDSNPPSPRPSFFGIGRFTVVALSLLLLATPGAYAGSFSLFGAWTDTDDLDDAVGGGLILGIPLGSGALDLDLRATYYEELVSDDFSAAIGDVFDRDLTVDDGLEILPVEIGLRYNFFEREAANFYIGGGPGYYFLDTDAGSIDDEFGFYVVLGGEFGKPDGVAFFVEGLYREVEGSVESGTDPDAFDDLDDVDFTSQVNVDIGGPAINAGITWRF